MDIRTRNLIRQYSAEPTDELAHQLARQLLRTEPSSNLMYQFYEAWWWLHEHPLFRYKGRMEGQKSFPECIEITTMKVDPKTRTIEDDKPRNTHVEIWIEVTTYETPDESDPMVGGSWLDTGTPCHHYHLDCGGDSYEEAIITLAHKLWERRSVYSFSEPWPECIPHRDIPQDELELLQEELGEINETAV